MTTKQAQYRQILEAGLRGDFTEAERLNAELGDIPFSVSAVLVGAVFYMAVQQRFATDSSPAAVHKFTKEALAEYADATPPIEQSVVDALVRAALGEEDLMQGLDAAETVPVQMSLVYKIVADLHLSDVQLAKLLNDGESLASSWAGQG